MKATGERVAMHIQASLKHFGMILFSELVIQGLCCFTGTVAAPTISKFERWKRYHQGFRARRPVWLNRVKFCVALAVLERVL